MIEMVRLQSDGVKEELLWKEVEEAGDPRQKKVVLIHVVEVLCSFYRL